MTAPKFDARVTFKSATETAMRRAFNEAIARAIDVVQTQPDYPDTKVGMRQQWVRDQIVLRLSVLQPDA